MTIAGSLKGHIFDPANESSLPHDMQDARRRAARLAPLAPDVKAAQAKALTDRYAVVETCGVKDCGEDLIAEERVQHRLNHEHGVVRSMVATVLQQPREHHKRILEVLKELLEG